MLTTKGKGVYGLVMICTQCQADPSSGRLPAPPPPRFGQLNNAFTTPTAVSRVKRARTEAMSPSRETRSPTKVPSPRASPLRNRAASVLRSSPAAAPVDLPEEFMEDGVMGPDWVVEPERELPMPIDEVDTVDHKSEVSASFDSHLSRLIARTSCCIIYSTTFRYPHSNWQWTRRSWLDRRFIGSSATGPLPISIRRGTTRKHAVVYSARAVTRAYPSMVCWRSSHTHV